MNPLTLVKRIQNLNKKEAALSISEEASWHAKYKDSAYVFVGGIPFDLTEGDLLAVFAQYGEIVDVNLVRDKGTGKSKGFAFIAYEDQRSTNLAVDNLNGAQVLGRIIRVDHVTNYKKKEEEDEATLQRKREERGVCRAFQRGECNRGAGCKFSHDEQRAADTGWGHEDDRSTRWGHNKFEGPSKSEKQFGALNRTSESREQKEAKFRDEDNISLRSREGKIGRESHNRVRESHAQKEDGRIPETRQHKERGTDYEGERDKNIAERKSRRHDAEPRSREDCSRREEKKSRRYESESYYSKDQDVRGEGNRSYRDRDSSSHHHKGKTEDERHRSRR